MNLTVIVEFESDDLLFFIIYFFDHLLQLQGVADQAAERSGQLIQRRLRQRFRVQPRQYRLAPLQHFKLQVERDAVALPSALLSILTAQVRFVMQPALQGAQRNLQKLADARHIAVVLINFVQRVDLGLERISSTHPSSFLDKQLRLRRKKRPPQLAIRLITGTAVNPSAYGDLLQSVSRLAHMF